MLPYDRSLSIAAAAVLLVAPPLVSRQLPEPNAAGIRMGHIHLIVPDDRGQRCPRREEQAHTNERKDCRDQSMPQHHDPMQPGLILDDFARDEMLFGVAQKDSSEMHQEICRS